MAEIGEEPGEVRGLQIGPYRIRRLIGEGGMGHVYEATQGEPVRRRVALKRLKLAVDSEQVLGRFESERQALALMSHPNIAQAYDAGFSTDGRPYFAMEYVEGPWITNHCDDLKLGIRERLDLFLQACRGIEHAHQKGVIHRDIKPSNILVQTEAGEFVPKVIDFGVAKAMGADFGGQRKVTRIGQFVGTPEYMSPEQAGPASFDVDTRTDVYALGVLLFELLTGSLPFERTAGDEDGLRRRIREEDAPTCSTRLGALGAEAVPIARARATDPSSLRRRIRGDLDWITAKALEKDRDRRYGSPAELAADLGRHLRNEPVQAGPPSVAYRASKFARRNRVAVAIAAAATLALIGFGVAMAVQSARIAREAEAKRRVSEFLTELFAVSDPNEARGNSITARELLDKGAARIRGTLTDDPDVRAELMKTMGVVYRDLGLYPQAEPLLEEALETQRRRLGPDDPEALRLATETAGLYLGQGRTEEADRLVRETLDRKKRVLGPAHPDTLRSMSDLVAVHAAQAHHKEAEALGRETLDARRRVLGPEHIDTLRSMSSLGRVYFAQGRLEEAEALFRESLDIARRVLDPGHPESFRSMTDLTRVYVTQGREKEAEALIRESFELSKRVLGPEHPDTLRSMLLLARSYTSHSRFKEADVLTRRTIAIQERVLGPEHPNTLDSKFQLGLSLHVQGDPKEAEMLFREIRDIRKRALGPEHLDTLRAMAGVANTVRDQGRKEEAEVLFRELLATQRRVLGPEHTKTLITMSDLALVYGSLGRFEEGEALAREAIAIQTRLFGPESPDTPTSMKYLGHVYSAQGRYKEAEALHRRTFEIAKRVLGPEHPYTLIFMDDLAVACAAQRRYEDAEVLYRDRLGIQTRALGPEHPGILRLTYTLACTEALLSKRSEALRYLRDAVAHGYSGAKAMTEDSDLRSLRGDPEFERIVAAARANQARAGSAR